MPQVVVDLNDGRGPRPAREALRDGPNDLSYFVRLAEVASALSDEFERFVISYSPAVADQLTTRDVWLLVGDETATPVENGRCPVLRTYGERFTAPTRDFMKDPLLALTEQVQLARNGIRGVWRNRGQRREPRNPPAWLPLGTPAFADVPDDVPPLGERVIDVGFRGSIGGGRPYAPKTISRRRMASAVARLPAELRSRLCRVRIVHSRLPAGPLRLCTLTARHEDLPCAKRRINRDLPPIRRGIGRVRDHLGAAPSGLVLRRAAARGAPVLVPTTGCDRRPPQPRLTNGAHVP